MTGLGLAAVLLLLVVGLMLVVGRWKADAFLVLLACAFIFGLSSGMGVETALTTIMAGFGNTLGGIGLVIIFGAIIGVFLERTGASGSIAEMMLRVVGRKRAGLALNMTGYIVSIPVFCDSGFIVLSPLAFALSRRTGISRLALALALATGLYATHCLVPPTPGPIGAAAVLGADLGRVIILGLPVALILSLVGYWWSIRFSAEQLPDVSEAVSGNNQTAERKAPGALRAGLPILVPLLLITLGSAVSAGQKPEELSALESLLKGLGHPVFALALGLLLGFPLARPDDPKGGWIVEGIKSCAIVLAVTAAGGAFGQVIRSSPLGEAVQQYLGGWKAGILVPFILSAALKSAQGSSTVAMITSAAIVQPLLGSLGLAATPWGPAMAVVAIGCGAMTVSHANDSYFWVVSQMAGIPVSTAYRTYTTATGLMGFSGALVLLALSLFLLN